MGNRSINTRGRVLQLYVESFIHFRYPQVLQLILKIVYLNTLVLHGMTYRGKENYFK